MAANQNHRLQITVCTAIQPAYKYEMHVASLHSQLISNLFDKSIIQEEQQITADDDDGHV